MVGIWLVLVGFWLCWVPGGFWFGSDRALFGSCWVLVGFRLCSGWFAGWTLAVFCGQLFPHPDNGRLFPTLKSGQALLSYPDLLARPCFHTPISGQALLFHTETVVKLCFPTRNELARPYLPTSAKWTGLALPSRISGKTLPALFD